MDNEKSQNQQLADYFKKNIVKGYTADALKVSLMKQGYSRTSVDNAYELANKQLAQQAPKMVEKPTITYTYDENELRNKVNANQEGFFSRIWHKIFH